MSANNNNHHNEDDHDEHVDPLEGIDEDYVHIFANLNNDKMPIFHRCALNEDVRTKQQ